MICTLRTAPATADPGATIPTASRARTTTPILRAGPEEEDRRKAMLAPLGEGDEAAPAGATPVPAHANRDRRAPPRHLRACIDRSCCGLAVTVLESSWSGRSPGALLVGGFYCAYYCQRCAKPVA